MRFLSFHTAHHIATEPLEKEYMHPADFWGDWNGLMGFRKWHRTELDPSGNPYTVKWESRAFRNGYGKPAVHTTALWVDGEHSADTRPPAPPHVPRPVIPSSQAGRAAVGERLRSPHGTWTVIESWIASKAGAQGKDRSYGPSVSGDSHMYYLLKHEDGHQEEWSAPDMADFHRIQPSQQQALT